VLLQEGARRVSREFPVLSRWTRSEAFLPKSNAHTSGMISRRFKVEWSGSNQQPGIPSEKTMGEELKWKVSRVKDLKMETFQREGSAGEDQKGQKATPTHCQSKLQVSLCRSQSTTEHICT
jgi:hypothetical protein